MSNANKIKIVLPENVSEQPLPLFIALHGNNSTIQLMQHYWETIPRHGYILAIFESSQESPFTNDRFIWNDLSLSLQEIRLYFETILNNYSVDTNKIYIGGFSRGAYVALRAVLSNVIPAVGLYTINLVIPDTELDTTIAEAQAFHNLAFRVSMLNGADDTHYGHHKPQQIIALLQSTGIETRFEARDGLDHEYPENFAEDISRVINFFQ